MVQHLAKDMLCKHGAIGARFPSSRFARVMAAIFMQRPIVKLPLCALRKGTVHAFSPPKGRSPVGVDGAVSWPRPSRTVAGGLIE